MNKNKAKNYSLLHFFIAIYLHLLFTQHFFPQFMFSLLYLTIARFMQPKAQQKYTWLRWKMYRDTRMFECIKWTFVCMMEMMWKNEKIKENARAREREREKEMVRAKPRKLHWIFSSENGMQLCKKKKCVYDGVWQG